MKIWNIKVLDAKLQEFARAKTVSENMIIKETKTKIPLRTAEDVLADIKDEFTLTKDGHFSDESKQLLKFNLSAFGLDKDATLGEFVKKRVTVALEAIKDPQKAVTEMFENIAEKCPEILEQITKNWH